MNLFMYLFIKPRQMSIIRKLKHMKFKGRSTKYIAISDKQLTWLGKRMGWNKYNIVSISKL